MANDKGITTGTEAPATEAKGGITSATEAKGGITTGNESSSGITTGTEMSAPKAPVGITPASKAPVKIITGREGAGDLTFVWEETRYNLADCGVPIEKILVLAQSARNGAWAGFVFQRSDGSHVFQTHDWQTVLDYSSRHDLLIKQAYSHSLTLEMSQKYPPIPASNWGWK